MARTLRELETLPVLVRIVATIAIATCAADSKSAAATVYFDDDFNGYVSPLWNYPNQGTLHPNTSSGVPGDMYYVPPAGSPVTLGLLEFPDYGFLGGVLRIEFDVVGDSIVDLFNVTVAGYSGGGETATPLFSTTRRPTGARVALNVDMPYAYDFELRINLPQPFVQGIDRFLLREGYAADFDNDGDVDGRDFLVWQRGGSPNPLSAGDLADWQANYRTPAVSDISQISGVTVPEPFSLGFCLLSLAAGLISRQTHPAHRPSAHMTNPTFRMCWK